MNNHLISMCVPDYSSYISCVNVSTQYCNWFKIEIVGRSLELVHPKGTLFCTYVYFVWATSFVVPQTLANILLSDHEMTIDLRIS